ncbi:MAG: recombinase family protein [Isosphaeraceae bacterium]|nr:recombinase family protein [Isosphaeraceae bacterium]
MAHEPTRRRRCATYTRKSSEEGLEQDFNSLDAQREACEAYIRSQAGEGWKGVTTRYDDGGYSGGNLDRPALQQLLADIQAKRIDTVVVYKVDRLTRSLADFAKIVEVLDSNGASFVSVTQQFNTTTSMGRLTLNMLLSFAQFEREVTGERIRDKIAASKRKGLWMGGFVPLGYEAAGRTLSVVEAEAKIVRRVYQLYLKLGSVPLVETEVNRLGLRTKKRPSTSKKTCGGKPFSRGHLYKILNNPIYAGRISHKGEIFPGQHPAIIEPATWQAVQTQLSEHAGERASQRNLTNANPLRGKLFDETGQALSPVHSTKAGRRYRYYVSRPDPAAEGDLDEEDTVRRWRLPAREIEQFVEKRTAKVLTDPGEMARLLREAEVPERKLLDLAQRLRLWRGHPKDCVARIDLGAEQISIQIDASEVVDAPGCMIRLEVPTRLQRRGVEARIVLTQEGSVLDDRRVDPALIKAIVRTRTWFDDLVNGRVASLEEIGRREGISDRYVGSLMSLGFLAPALITRTLDGTQPLGMTMQNLVTRVELPIEWRGQLELLEI